ncbi:MAG: LPXTG cell wall anchor domain-containing protein, partial [Ruminococcus sp.]|nr:LPXTG cell wall anchor domain-containing protein [Ruminococcus sp.]
EEATTSTTTEKATTTTTTEESITSTTTEESTTTTTITSVEKSVVPHITSDEELISWAVNDYNRRNYTSEATSATINENADGSYQMIIKDDSDNVLDVYEINPENGIGTDNADNEVNLPQTGNNSLTNLLTALGALVMTAVGFISIKSSGIIRRKKNN